MLKRIGLLFILVSLVIGFTACKKASETADEESVSDDASNVVDSAIGEVSEQAGSIVTASIDPELFDEDGNLFSDSQSYETLSAQRPAAVCSFAAARSSCSSATITVDWAACTLGTSTATLSGVITEKFSSFGAASCQLNGNGSQLDRMVSESSPRTITFATGAKIISDMSPGTAWDGTTFPTAGSTSVIRYETGTSNGLACATGTLGTPCYNIIVRGNQTVMTGPRGRKWFDHIVTANLTAKGRKATNDLFVVGTTAVWHQVSEYKAVHTFGSVTWGSSSCCFPTAGSVSSAFTGSISGNATTVFSSTCGQASFTGTDSVTKTITLTQCQP